MSNETKVKFYAIGFTVSAVTADNQCSCTFYAWRNDEDFTEPVICGFIRYDGCSDWNFDSPVHFCDAEGVNNLGVLMDRIYAMAAELIPKWDDKV